MIQPAGSEEALNALAEFKAYAAGSLLALDLIGTFVFALSGAVAGGRAAGVASAMPIAPAVSSTTSAVMMSAASTTGQRNSGSLINIGP